MVALRPVAPEVGQNPELVGRLHAFGYRREVEGVGQLDDCLDDNGVVAFDPQAGRQGLVDLQGVDREAREVGQRGKVRAEVVDGILTPRRCSDLSRRRPDSPSSKSELSVTSRQTASGGQPTPSSSRLISFTTLSRASSGPTDWSAGRAGGRVRPCIP